MGVNVNKVTPFLNRVHLLKTNHCYQVVIVYKMMLGSPLEASTSLSKMMLRRSFPLDVFFCGCLQQRSYFHAMLHEMGQLQPTIGRVKGLFSVLKNAGRKHLCVRAEPVPPSLLLRKVHSTQSSHLTSLFNIFNDDFGLWIFVTLT